MAVFDAVFHVQAFSANPRCAQTDFDGIAKSNRMMIADPDFRDDDSNPHKVMIVP